MIDNKHFPNSLPQTKKGTTKKKPFTSKFIFPDPIPNSDLEDKTTDGSVGNPQFISLDIIYKLRLNPKS